MVTAVGEAFEEEGEGVMAKPEVIKVKLKGGGAVNLTKEEARSLRRRLDYVLGLLEDDCGGLMTYTDKGVGSVEVEVE